MNFKEYTYREKVKHPHLQKENTKTMFKGRCPFCNYALHKRKLDGKPIGVCWNWKCKNYWHNSKWYLNEDGSTGIKPAEWIYQDCWIRRTKDSN